MLSSSFIIDILTMALYMSLFLIGSESLNSQLFSWSSAALAILIPVIGSVENKGIIKIELKKTKLYFTWAILFIIFCYVSSLWAIRPNLAITKGNSILKNALCMLLIYLYYQKIDNLKRMLKVVMYGGYAVIIFSIAFFGVDAFSDAVSSSSRLSNEFLNQNILGMLAAFTILVNLYFILYYKEEKKALILAAISLVVLATAGSRKSILELGLGVVLLFTLKNYKKGKFLSSLLKIIGVVILIAGVGYLLLKLPMFSLINSRLEHMFNLLIGSGDTDSSVRSRALLNGLGFEIFLEHPVLGIGIDCARIPAMQLTGQNWYLHNNFLELLADGGIVGFGIFYSIYAILIIRFIKLRKYRDPEYDISLVLMLVQLVLGYAYVSYYGRDTYFYLLIYFMETEILERRKSQVSENNKFMYNLKEASYDRPSL